jgi:hypothetical protein
MPTKTFSFSLKEDQISEKANKPCGRSTLSKIRPGRNSGVFDQNPCRRPRGGILATASGRRGRGSCTDWITRVRGGLLAENFPPEQTFRILGVAGRYVQAARDLMAADEQFARLRLPLYMGDFAL